MANDLHRTTDHVARNGSGIPGWGIALGVAAVAVALASRARPRYRFENKVVLITGGSRGLGLVLARELANQGALIALMARDALELARAKRTMPSGSVVQVLAADVTVPSQVEQSVDDLVGQMGRLDVVINNAGQILSGPFDDTTAADFRSMFDVHVWGTLNVTRAALPHLRRRHDGRVINICSIGARIPVPHLSAYCASKFAQAGLSGVMAEELRAQGIRVTTVLPGLMRTGSHVQAWFKGDHAREFALFSLIGGLPGTSMSAERAARLIVDAAAKGRMEIVLPFSVRQIARMASLLPNVSQRTLSVINGVLPRARSQFALQGRHIELNPAVEAAISLSERAADRNNQR